MSTTLPKLLTTRELASARGLTRQAISRAVREHRIEPAATLANGAYLFTEDQADAEGGES
ncbi:MAG: hypothetical protein ACK5O2_00765 [Microthrixaceae bacterium]